MLINNFEKLNVPSFAQRKKRPPKANNAAVKPLKPEMPLEKNAASFFSFYSKGATPVDLHKFVSEVIKADKQQGGARNTIGLLIDLDRGKLEGKTFARAIQEKMPKGVVIRLIDMTNRMYSNLGQPGYISDMLKNPILQKPLRKAGMLDAALKVVKRLKR